jgi:hypothetical protein
MIECWGTGAMGLQDRARQIARFVDDGEAASRWAVECGWLAGSGLCRTQRCAGCSSSCSFLLGRLNELAAIRRHRMRRRNNFPRAGRR